MTVQQKAVPPSTNRSNQPHAVWRVVPWLRWLLIPYFFVVGFCGLVSIAIMSYGLAHASSGSSASFLAMVTAAMLAAATPPLSFLLKSQASWVRALQALGMLVFAITMAVFAKLLFYSVIEPQLWSQHFAAVTKPIAIESVIEERIVINQTPIGLRVTANVRLPKDVALDRSGAVLLDALSSLQLSAPELKGGNRSAPFGERLSTSVTFEGKPINDLLGMKAYREKGYGWVPDGKTTLPAGLYQVSQHFWLSGLRRSDKDDYSDPNPVPCKIDLQEANPNYFKAEEQPMAC